MEKVLGDKASLNMHTISVFWYSYVNDLRTAMPPQHVDAIQTMLSNVTNFAFTIWDQERCRRAESFKATFYGKCNCQLEFAPIMATSVRDENFAWFFTPEKFCVHLHLTF